MPLLLLLLLTLACLPDNWEFLPRLTEDVSPEASALSTWLACAAVIGLAGLLSYRTCRSLLRAPAQREKLLHRYQTWRFYHQAGLFLAYLVALYVFQWGWTVQQLSGPDRPLFPGAEFLVLAPLVTGLILSWCCFYSADRAFHNVPAPPNLDRAFEQGLVQPEPAQTPFWSRWSHLSFHLRHNLALVCVPVVLIVLVKAIGRLIPNSEANNWQQAASLVGMAATGCIFLAMPWVLRVLLALKPLPDGPMRDRLLAASRRLNFRCSNVLLWNTRGHVANAMVAGVLPWLRYVILTDRLLQELTPEEIEAVFGHEIGHIKHHHMLFYLGFLLASIATLWAGYCLLQDQFEDWWVVKEFPELTIPPFIVAVGVYLFVVFGFLSRRCERQADLYGCRAVSCFRKDCFDHASEQELAPVACGLCPTGIHTFMDALEKVGHLNGISRDRPGFLQSWQHSTIARRVHFLAQVLADQRVETRFQRRVAMVKWALLLGVAVVLLTLVHTGWDKIPF
ncbi:MAG TPA: M48 family metallopeptidase [Gemmataceae bacterium]